MVLRNVIVEIFDDVMRQPESTRGLDVEETCRLLAESIRSRLPKADYEAGLLEAERYYLDQFLHTTSMIPDFRDKIRRGIRLYL